MSETNTTITTPQSGHEAPASPATEAVATPSTPANPAAPAAQPSKTVDEQLLDAFNAARGTPEAGKGGDAGQPGNAVEPTPTDPPADVIASAREMLGLYSTHAPKAKDMDPSQALSQAKELATEALRRWKWDEDVIASLPEPLLLAKGQAARKEQRVQDQRSEQHNDLRAVLEELGYKPAAQQQQQAGQGNPAEGDGAGDAEEVSKQPAQFSPDLEAAINEIAAMQLDDNLAPALRKGITGELSRMQSSIMQAVNEKLGEITRAKNDEVEDAYRQLDGVMFKLVTRELAESTGNQGFRDPQRIAALQAKVRQLSNLDGYHDDGGHLKWQEVVSDAYQMLYGREESKTIQAQMVQRHRQQTRGTPTPVNSPTPGRLTTPEEALMMASRELASGKTAKEVREQVAASLRTAG